MNSILATWLKIPRSRGAALSRHVRSAAPGSLTVSALLVMLAVSPALGCSSAAFITKVRGANERFEEAKTADAEKYSPYEYYGAEARLGQAKQLAAVAEYGSAIQLANESRALSEQAIVNTKKARSPSSAPAKAAPSKPAPSQSVPSKAAPSQEPKP